MENDKLNKSLTENGVEILRKIDDKSNVNITLQIQTILNKTVNYRKVIACDNESTISLYFSPQFTAKIGDIVTLIAVYPLRNNNPYDKGQIIVNSYKIEGNCSKLLSSEKKKKEENIESKITKADSNQKSDLFKEEQEDSFNYKHCQYLSYLTTFTKDVHIYVKIERKYDIRTFKNKRTNQDNKLFSVKMIDIEGFEMIATAYGDIVDKFYNILQEGEAFEIRGGYVRINEKKFSPVKADYKLILEGGTEIIPRPDNGLFNKIQYNFSTIEDLNNYAVGAIIDIIAIVIEVMEPMTITTKLGPQIIRRIRIGDASGYKIEMTLWRQLSEIHIEPNTMILIRNIKVGEYNGKNLSSTESTEIIFEENLPEIEEVEILKKFRLKDEIDWKFLPSYGILMEASAPGETKYLKEIINEIELEDTTNDKMMSSQKSKGDRRPLVKFKATICSLNHSERNYYMGCPEQQCKKKLVQDNNGTFCEHCNKQIAVPKYYYTISLRVRDASGDQYVDVFGEVAAKILGYSAEEYKTFIDTEDIIKLHSISENLEFHDFIFIGSCRINEYNGVRKKRISCYRIEPIERKMNAKIQLRFLQSILLNKNK